MINERDIVTFYQYFYRKRYRSLRYRFLLKDEKKRQLCETFVSQFNKLYEDNAGKTLLWNYFIYQFIRWEGVTLVDKGFGDSGKLMPNMIIGSKAFNKFKERDQAFDWTFTNTTIIQKYGFYKVELFDNEVVKKEPVQRKGIEIKVNRDPNKSAFLNTDAGFATCVEMTSLYDEKDVSCKKCIFKDTCLELLKKEYPKIYEQQYGGKD